MNDNAFAETIAAAITSGLLWPSVGAVLVLLAILADRYRSGIDVRAQLAALWASSRRPLTTGLSTAGLALVASTLEGGPTPVQALAGGLTVALVMLGARPIVPLPPPPSSPTPPPP